MAYVTKDRTIYYNEILKFCKDEKRTVKEVYQGTQCTFTGVYLREILKLLSNEGYLKHTKISRMEQFYQTKIDEITQEQVEFILNNSIRHRVQGKRETREDQLIKDRNKLLNFCYSEPKTITQISEALPFSVLKIRSLLAGLHRSYVEVTTISRKFAGFVKTYQSKTQTYEKTIYDPCATSSVKLITFDGALDQKRQREQKAFDQKYGREKKREKVNVGTTFAMMTGAM